MSYNSQDPYEDGNPTAQSQDGGDRQSDESEHSDEPTALLPKSFFQGKELEIGGRCEVEITQVHEDEVSVRYLAHDESEKEPGGGESASSNPPAKGDAEMSSLLE